VEYIKYLGSMITNDTKCIREIKSKIAMTKGAFNKLGALLTNELDLSLKKKLVKF